MKCPKCQADNPETKKFCGECGTALEISEEPTEFFTRTLETPVDALKTGATFANRYQIIEELGEGGMGKVYKVLDTEIDARIALKLIKADIAADQKTIERFRNELKTARDITHKNVCRMYHMGKHEGHHYITMEFVDGEDLKGTIKRVGPVGIGKTVAIAKQVCEGLAEAHRVGVVHRDLKPNNIMIDRDGNAKIMDFGIARSVKTKGVTGDGVIIGTPEYMSPEQAEAKELDFRSDIYSFGVILFEMLTGQLPFTGDTPLSIALKHVKDRPDDPRTLNPQIPEDMARLILKCLGKDKQDRYQSADELLGDLNCIEKDMPTTTKEVVKVKTITSREITVSFTMKKLLMPALIVLALIIAGLIVWQPWSKRDVLPPTHTLLSIAVLPFEDLSPQKDQEYVCDGMTDQLILNLTKIPQLKVIARASVMQFKNRQKNIQQISEELGVKYLLDGTIRKSGSQLSVSASLIDAAEGVNIWANDYRREWEDIITIQDDVSRSIVNALEITLTDQTERAIQASYPRSAEAYDYYLQARHYVMNTYVLTKKEEDFEHALALAKKAVELDPESAYGYMGLAFLYENHWLVTDNAKDAEKERANIEKAFELNPELSEVNAALGLMRVREGKYDEAFSYLKTAMEINPNELNTLHIAGMFYQIVGLFHRSVQFYTKALDIDPLNFYTLMNRGGTSLRLGAFEDALKDIEKSDQIMPDNTYNLDSYALVLVLKKSYKKAGEIMNKIESLPRGYSFYSSLTKALYLAGTGEPDKALEESRHGIVLALLGRMDEALDAIEKAIKDNAELYRAFYSYLPLTNLDIYDSLRDDPRFQEIVRKEKQKYEQNLKKYAF
jgi:serine/threonine protein kinase/Tfp pilus assembly protein PilF